ncbi:hypothetical protein CRUP_013543, partial [Coryphaenoides rupestris]
SRNDLAEALDLLKAQIDPKLTQTQGGSASGSPEREAKADTDDQNPSAPSEPPRSTQEETTTEPSLQRATKQEEAGLVKQEVATLIKQEEAEVKPQTADLAADRKSPAASFPVIDNRVSTITAIIKPEAREPDVPSNTPSNAVSVVMAPASVITKQEVKREEEAERAVVRSSQQAKIPLKKRELKLAEGFQDNRNHGNHLNNNSNNKGSSIIVCNPSVIQSKDAG